MSINLEIGQQVLFSQEVSSLSKLKFGMGWTISGQAERAFLSKFGKNKQSYDLNTFVICLDEFERLVDPKDIIYFDNLRHRSGAIIHQGDNLIGAGDEDKEAIIVDLKCIPAHVTKLIFVVNIDDCENRNQSFEYVQNVFVRLVNCSNYREFARFELSGQGYVGMTGLVLSEVSRQYDEWKMVAISKGVCVGGISELIHSYA